MSDMINEKEIKLKNRSRRDNLEDLGVDGRILLKQSLDIWDVGACVSWSGHYDHGNGCLGYLKGREWLGHMNQIYIHMKDFAALSY
jgi:hypothetical protein